MSTSDKLIYLNGTKQALKESINNLGGDITSETTFREYAQELDNIYDNLPKTTGEDTNLSLTTLKGKMNIIPKGDTYQYTTTGKNKIPYPYAYDTRTVNGITFTVNTDGTINVNGTATANATFVIQNQATASGLRELLLNNNCFLSGCPSGGSSSAYMQLYGYSSGGTGAKADTGNGVSVAGFVNENNNFNIAIVILSGTTVNNLLFAPQLEIGSSKTPWEPYTNGASPNPSYPQEVKVVRGKNIAKEVKNTEVTTAYNGVLYLDIENDLQPNTTYTLSFIGKNGYKVYLNENITTAQWITCNGNKQSLTFTTNGNIDKTNSGQYSTSVGGWVIFKNQTGNTEVPTFDEVMLEERKYSYFLSTL